MMKDKFCPFLSKERPDGKINKVDCSKKCALYTGNNEHNGVNCSLLAIPLDIHKSLYDLRSKVNNIQRLLEKSQ